ncbi:MAG: hypothetical protein L0229_19710 [Blastocatellia bacterium]|nr:hypothetical protein [Blastocatellia bacterium]
MAKFTEAQKKKLQETVAGVINGKKMKEHRVVKHRWNFEPLKALEITRRNGTLIAKGRFTHYLRVVRDDVVTYGFKIDNGQVKDFEFKYKDRGWSEAVNVALKGLAAYFGKDSSSLEDLNDKLGNAFDGGVPEEAQVIVANIAMALKLKEQRRQATTIPVRRS